MKEIYMDNSATTKAYEEVADIVKKVMCLDYGNPSSVHRKGMGGEAYIREGKAVFSAILKVREKEIFFTSGGTESDNMAIIGGALANQRRGRHLITTQIEHPAVLNTMAHMEDQGFEVTYLPVDACGRFSPADLKKALRPDTICVSIMHVNNEIGSVQPIAEAGEIIKKYDSRIVFHVDAVQSFGRYKIYPSRTGIDMLSISGHKIHGPKGIGVLYISEGSKIRPVFFGGGQQKSIRPGTENVPGIAGIALAAKMSYDGIDEKMNRIRGLREALISGITDISGTIIHGAEGEDSAPHIVSAGFLGVPSEVLLHALEAREIYVSAGSACASNHPMVSRVLRAAAVDKDYLRSTIRLSMSELTTKDEVEAVVRALRELVPSLRQYKRR